MHKLCYKSIMIIDGKKDRHYSWNNVPVPHKPTSKAGWNICIRSCFVLCNQVAHYRGINAWSAYWVLNAFPTDFVRFLTELYEIRLEHSNEKKPSVYIYRKSNRTETPYITPIRSKLWWYLTKAQFSINDKKDMRISESSNLHFSNFPWPTMWTVQLYCG